MMLDNLTQQILLTLIIIMSICAGLVVGVAACWVLLSDIKALLTNRLKGD